MNRFLAERYIEKERAYNKDETYIGHGKNVETMKKNRSVVNVGVDIGGTKIALGLVTLKGEILSQKTFPTCPEKGDDWIIDRLVADIHQLIDQSHVDRQTIRSIGIGVPGTVDIQTGHVILAPNLCWRNIPLGPKLNVHFRDIPVYIDQDTKVAALGEYIACGDASVENLFFMTISTGIGAGIILNRTLFRGRLNTAGEIGHCVVEKHGKLCSCGNRGCLEMYAKGPAIAEIALQRITNGEPSSLQKQVRLHDLNSIHVAEAALRGDALAQDVLLNAAEYVGFALVNVITLLNPDLIVIGGGVARSGGFFLERIREVTERYCYPPMKESYKIVLTNQWEKSAIIGAGLLYQTYHNSAHKSHTMHSEA